MAKNYVNRMQDAPCKIERKAEIFCILLQQKSAKSITFSDYFEIQIVSFFETSRAISCLEGCVCFFIPRFLAFYLYCFTFSLFFLFLYRRYFQRWPQQSMVVTCFYNMVCYHVQLNVNSQISTWTVPQQYFNQA